MDDCILKRREMVVLVVFYVQSRKGWTIRKLIGGRGAGGRSTKKKIRARENLI